MGWGRYLMPSWWNAEEANELDERLKRVIARGRQRRAAEGERMRELEADLGRVTLLARSLAELCLKKGVITRAELKAELFATDLDDGVADQSLAPKFALPGETRLSGGGQGAKPAPKKKNK